jgi:hypothetical protein
VWRARAWGEGGWVMLVLLCTYEATCFVLFFVVVSFCVPPTYTLPLSRSCWRSRRSYTRLVVTSLASVWSAPWPLHTSRRHVYSADCKSLLSVGPIAVMCADPVGARWFCMCGQVALCKAAPVAACSASGHRQVQGQVRSSDQLTRPILLLLLRAFGGILPVFLLFVVRFFSCISFNEPCMSLRRR